MQAMQVVLRLIHIVGGVFWAGAMIFNAAFLFPALQDAGPDGAKVAAGVVRRKFATITPIIALFTILAGFALMDRASGHFKAAYFSTGTGATLAVGAVCALIAFAIGLTVTRPSMMRAMALSQGAAQAAPAEREQMVAQASAFRARAGSSGVWVAVLLTVAAAAMAIARYM